ncbi:MAG: hypothetical protein BMS9Abin20_0924 [Acidimicrobiia bacterium]|nr:MAG: hypothetical protein BMS9Abin20_0924 [Acidimicrobiia bacterium]
MDLSKLSKNHKIALAGGVLALISMFLPWYGVSFGAIASANFNAWSVGILAWGGLVLAIAGAVILILKALDIQDVTVANLAAEQLALVLAGAGIILIVLRLLTQTSFVRYGLFLGFISAAAVAYGAYASMKEAGLELPGKESFGSVGGSTSDDDA